VRSCHGPVNPRVGWDRVTAFNLPSVFSCSPSSFLSESPECKFYDMEDFSAIFGTFDFWRHHKRKMLVVSGSVSILLVIAGSGRVGNLVGQIGSGQEQ